jgi:hypothetical protein
MAIVLLVDPFLQICRAVENPAALAKAVRSGTEMAPVPQARFRRAEDGSGFVEGEQIAVVRLGTVRTTV